MLNSYFSRELSGLKFSPVVAGVIVFICCIARLLWLSSLSDAELIKFIPDDAFYYLVLAKNFSETARWSFDGTSPASGFHLLWGYFLASVYYIFPNLSWRMVFISMSFVGCVAYSMAASITSFVVKSVSSIIAIYGVVFVFLSGAAISQSTILMETPFVLLFSAILFKIAFSRECRSTLGVLVLSGLLGLLGMLSRSDFGLIPLVFSLTSVFSRDRRGVVIGIAALFGAVIGLVAVSGHTYWVSGEFAPASAQIKSYWAKIEGPSIIPGYQVLLSLIVPNILRHEAGIYFWYASLFFLLMLVAACCAVYSSRKSRSVLTVCSVSALIILSYLVLYIYNGAIQSWYVANFIVPLALLVGVALSLAFKRAWLVSLIASLVILACSWMVSFTAPWPWQASMLKGAFYLKNSAVTDPVGAWNAGIVSFFSGRKIVNLDGLVNDSILPYVKNDALLDYVSSQKIAYILDFPIMLTGFFSNSRGHADGELSSCLLVENPVFKAPLNEQFGGDLTLYKMRESCL